MLHEAQRLSVTVWLWHSKIAVNVFLQRHGSAILKGYALHPAVDGPLEHATAVGLDVVVIKLQML